MRRLIIILLFLALAGSLPAQTISNGTFSVGAPTGSGAWNYGPVANWTCSPDHATGLYNPPANLLTASTPTVLWSDSGYCSQDTGAPAAVNAILTLIVGVGHRTDVASAGWSISMIAGGAAIPGCAPLTGDVKTIPAGTSSDQTLTCNFGASPPAADITVVLTGTSGQVDFSNIRLLVGTSGPLTFPFHGANNGTGFVVVFPIQSINQLPVCNPAVDGPGQCTMYLILTLPDGTTATGQNGGLAIAKTVINSLGQPVTITVPIVTVTAGP
jgi:hypothetical protein